MTDLLEGEKQPVYRELEALAEKSYDDMYDGRVAGRWSDIKEYLGLAILAAEREGLQDEANRLRKRLAHIREVVRSQLRQSFASERSECIRYLGGAPAVLAGSRDKGAAVKAGRVSQKKGPRKTRAVLCKSTASRR